VHAHRVAPASPAAPAFRPDIQGLRAIAVLLVVAFHLWPEAVTGGFVGVDVFFVISGFLITGHLLQHPPRSARDLLDFWGRRIRRILPAALLVLAVTAIATRLVVPETRWVADATETIASALYVENWALAATSVDYLAAAAAPSPVQHYWSLSIEEQFYIVWPVLLLGAYWLARRLTRTPLPVVRLAMLALIGGSLFISATATANDPASAYFITQTRVWELALGGFVATMAPMAWSLRFPALGDGLAWVGLAMICAAGLVITETTPFPGTAALLPVLGAALVILAAAGGRGSPTRLLAVRPIQHIGDTSYSIYLWHWPLIVLWPYVFGRVDPVPILVASLALASVSKVLVEDRVRFAPSLQPLVPTFRFAAVGMLIVSLLGVGLHFEGQRRIDEAMASAVSEEDPAASGRPADGGDDWDTAIVESSPTGEEPEITVEEGAIPEEAAASDAAPTAAAGSAAPSATAEPGSPTPSPDPAAGVHTCLGAASIVRGFDACPQDPSGRMRPDPVTAAGDVSAAYRDGCWIYPPFSARTMCRYGSGKVKIALVGNSHAGQWLPALQVLAKRHGWTITTFLASRCNATDATLELWGGTAGCRAFGRWVMDKTKGDAFDLVITSERQSVAANGDEDETSRKAAEDGYRTYLKKWSKAHTNVLVLRDTPFPGRTVDSVPDCLALHRSRQTACSGTRNEWRSSDPLYDVAVRLGLPGISTFNTIPLLCTESTCPAVIGSVVAYFDASHITATFARSAARFIDAPIRDALSKRKR
jgi:peptidoglycan/LPS O-acetylase OafA/YrhL